MSIFTDKAPIAKAASIEDLKGALVYLASETSDFMVGQDIVIYGGYINILFLLQYIQKNSAK